MAEKAREDEKRRKEERERAKLEAAKRKEIRRLQKAEVRARDTHRLWPQNRNQTRVLTHGRCFLFAATEDRFCSSACCCMQDELMKAAEKANKFGCYHSTSLRARYQVGART